MFVLIHKYVLFCITLYYFYLLNCWKVVIFGPNNIQVCPVFLFILLFVWLSVTYIGHYISTLYITYIRHYISALFNLSFMFINCHKR